MKLSTLIELIGSGWILLVAGVSMVGLGTAYGLNEALHLPMWACLIGLGMFLAIVGYVFLDRGNEEAEQQVKQIPLAINALKSPWLKVGAAVLGGIILAKLTSRGRREVIIEKTVLPPHESDQPPPGIRAESGPANSGGTGFTHYIGEQLKTFGALAGGAALSLGMEALGIPSVEELINDLMGNKKGNEKPSTNGASRSGEGNVQAERRAPVRSGPSHNGYNPSDEFDPIS